MLFGFFGVECFKANGMEKRSFPLKHTIPPESLFINILQAAFALKFFCQKNSKPSFN